MVTVPRVLQPLLRPRPLGLQEFFNSVNIVQVALNPRLVRTIRNHVGNIYANMHTLIPNMLNMG